VEQISQYVFRIILFERGARRKTNFIW
jgi:hypothetical protein